MNLKSKTKFGFIKLKAGFPPIYHPVTDRLLALAALRLPFQPQKAWCHEISDVYEWEWCPKKLFLTSGLFLSMLHVDSQVSNTGQCPWPLWRGAEGIPVFSPQTCFPKAWKTFTLLGSINLSVFLVLLSRDFKTNVQTDGGQVSWARQ